MSGTYVDCEGTIIYTYTYTSCDGTTSFDWVYTYTIDQTTAPAEVGGPVATASTVECAADAVAPTLPVVQDVCGNVVTPTGPAMSGTYVDCEGTIIYTYTYTSCDGTTSFDWVYTYTIDQTTAPAEVGGPVATASTVECAADAVAPTLPVVQDVCGNVVTPTGPAMSGTYVDCEGTIIYTYTYTSCDGTTSFDWVYTYTIDQTTAPAEVGGPVATASTVECAADAVAPTLPVVQDVCGNVVTPTGPAMSGTYVDCEGTIIYTYTYTSCDGTTSFDWVYTYTIDQTTAPAEVGGPVATASTVECAADAVAPTLPVVQDVCGNVVTPTGPAMSGTYVDCEGTIIYTYTYTSCDGTTSFDWVYTYTIDQTTAPAEVGGPVATASTVECAADAVAPTLPVVQDVCGNVVTPTGPAMSGTYVDCEGTIIYTYTYTSCDGTTSFDWVYTYTIDQTTAPAEVGGPVATASTVECAADAVAPTLPVVQDVCGKVVTPTGPAMSGTYVDCEGTIIYTYTYTSCDGTTSFDWVYTYTIDQTTAPAEVGGPVATASTVECAADAVAPTLPVVQDVCGNVVTPTGPAMSGTYVDCEGTIIYTYTYTSCDGTTSFDWVYTYTIDQTTAPAEVGGPVATASTVECAADAVAPTLPVVQDVCGNVVTPTGPAMSGTYVDCEGTIIYTYTYTSCDGTTSFDWVYTYTIDQTTAPAEVGGPVATASTVECAADAVAPTLPVVQDVCGNVVTPTGPAMSGTYVDCEGTIIYTYTYTSCDGTTSFDWVYTYTIDQTTAPAEVGGPVATASTVECAADAVAPTLPVVQDVCGKVVTPTGPAMSGTYVDCEGTIIYTYTYTSCDGTTSFDWVYTYTIDQTTAPAEVGGPVATVSTVECAADAVAPTLPVVQDVCGNVVTPTGPAMSGTYVDCEGTIIYTYNYTACEGNDHSTGYIPIRSIKTIAPANVGGPVATVAPSSVLLLQSPRPYPLFKMCVGMSDPNRSLYEWNVC